MAGELELDNWQSGTLDVLDLLHHEGPNASFDDFADIFDLAADEPDLPVVDGQAESLGRDTDGVRDARVKEEEAYHHDPGPEKTARSPITTEAPTSTATTGEFTMGKVVTNTNADQAAQSERRQHKRRRVRNAEQMELNRQAQQRYRLRKKEEQSELQNAVNALTAQLAAGKALEAKFDRLQGHSHQLQQQLQDREGEVSQLQRQVQAQSAQLAAADAQLQAQRQSLASQHHIILDQRQKMQLQHDIIEKLKHQLRNALETAFTNINSMVPGSVCPILTGAVKSAILSAKDLPGMQSVLAQLPDAMVQELCKNIVAACKEMWPELKLKLIAYGVNGAHTHSSSSGSDLERRASSLKPISAF